MEGKGNMLKTKRVRSEYDSYHTSHDEYETECMCSICGGYLGSKDFTYKTAHLGEFDYNAKFCKYCGAPLYEQN